MFKRAYEFCYRVYRVASRTLIKYSSNPRPSTLPYITGDGFRNFADHIYDMVHPNVEPSKIKDREVVFVGDSTMKKFFQEIHPKIKAKYVLVTHNGDAAIDTDMLRFVDDKILKWYGINVGVQHPKIVPIPLGIENKHLYLCGIPWIFNRVIKKKFARRNKIFYGFTIATNPAERQPAFDALFRNPLAETIKKWMNFNSYLNLLATYKFVASPTGSCVEGHRTWDALYIGIVPIVSTSITADYFKKLGMPIWVLSRWDELDGLTEEKLAEKYEQMTKGVDRSVLFLNYWTDKIRNIRD